MLLNSSAIIGNSIHISYAQWNYPYLYQHVKIVGFLSEIWKLFGYKVVYHQYPYESDSESDTCDGVLQSVFDGSTITAAGGSSPSVRRSKLFRMSLPVYYTSSSRADEEESAAFSFFAVFSVPALILLIISFIIIAILNYFTGKLRKRCSPNLKRHFVHSIVTELTNVVCLIALTVVIYYHAAGFKGNNVMSIPPKTTSFTELQKGLHSGSRSLITQSRTTIAAAKIAALTRNRTTTPDLIEPNHSTLLKKMCDDPKLVTMLERYTVLGPTMVDRPCEFRRIAVPTDSQILHNFDRTVMQNLMFSKIHTDRKTVEKINLVLLKFFDQDLIETFWTRRFSKTRKVFGDPPQSNAMIDETFRIMSLQRLVPLFYTTIPGWICSIAVFIFELAIAPGCKILSVRLPMTK